MNYREKLYSGYVSTHTSHLYDEATLDGFKRQFPVWKRYFGRALPENKMARILDIGCGNGGFVYFLQSLGYQNSQGIDISKEQIEEAKRLGIQNVEYGDLIRFLKDKKFSYDVIFAKDVIEHFRKEEILDVVSFVFDSLKPEGRFVIQASNAQSLFGSMLRYADFTHEIAFTQDSLYQLLTTAGFKEISFFPTGPVPKGIKSAVRFILWKAIQGILRSYMLVERGNPKGIYTSNIIAIARK
jgi:2-polyprenyl-3-methyl-5-hydroxy-6-metoxy-1,4-benzoquinol methylase